MLTLTPDMKRKILPYILLALLLSMISIVYQRMSGPNYPYKFQLKGASETYKLKLPKTATSDADFKLEFAVSEQNMQAILYLRPYPGSETFDTIPMIRTGENLMAYMPKLPSAGKYEYYVEFNNGAKTTAILKDKPMKIRFNDPVPDEILITHVLFMVLATFFSMMVTLLTVRKHPSFRKYGFMAFIALTIGGLILGPIVQKYAFGEFWTGFPKGMDLTDNKTLIAWIFYLVAILMNLKKDRPYSFLIASIVFILINLIPHSMFGSELDPNTGEIIQG